MNIDNREKLTKKLSLREKIGQLIVVRTTGYIFDHQIRYPAWEATQSQLKKWLQELNLGGVILLGGSCAEIAYRTQQLQSWAKTPLLIAADIEEGVGQRFTGATWFPPPMALSKIALDNLSLAQKYAQDMGNITAKEALAIGINWILAPITDVNNNPDNPVINVRSFGDNPQVVSDLATSFIKGCQSYPVLTTAKHFPGHGDTTTDSHLHLPQVNHNLERLGEIELLPFQQAITEGVDSIMTAHLLVSAFDGINPATLSFSILTQLLREKMNFSGLIVTDALIMGGVAKYATQEEIAVKAIQAGADILLMPENPEVAVNSIEKAIHDGILSEARIDQSLTRIIEAKSKLSFQMPHIDIISPPEARSTVNEILVKSMSYGGQFPMKAKDKGINLVVVQDLLNCDFLHRQTPAITIPESYGYQTQIFDQRNLHLAQYDDQDILLQAFIRGNPFLGNGGLTDSAKVFYEKLLKLDRVVGIVIYGSPYILDWFLPRLKKNTPWVFTYGQMSEAQELTCQYLFNLSTDHDIKKGDFL
ncbi:glycoside hydrolase family 3 N-terminal domain-containing protein [Geminocystis sp. NIES-3709]|uniref:glycoside hydrolase family 3 N-terminal domain-containing protein n=1 Tax=Geminocystis sp. NIES-3709 TaxID=1617448 RepID=UPI0005FC53B9|nr:glycoside hydrolase family 3 N-terminal domain-containing protein [Geminocystis sp. NIES-3709]BAQ63737.1 beta-hexosaminidase [Geminocystis sp. NIES-3709]